MATRDAPPDSLADLTGKLLIAMPGMGDPRFEHSVVFLCAHSDEGAMGLIVNKRVPEIGLDDLLEQLEIERGEGSKGQTVHFGGPVEGARGFVLQSDDYGANSSTLDVGEGFGMTATLDILEDISFGRGPAQAILALGYAGWAPGQLEDEILENGWLTCDATPDIVFGLPNAEKWNAALKSLGIDALMLSGSAGLA